MRIRRSCNATWTNFSQAVARPFPATSTEPHTFSTIHGSPTPSRDSLRVYRLLPPRGRQSSTSACIWYLVKVISSWSLPRLRLVACPPRSTIYSALKAVRSLNTGTRSKRFHLAINGRIATANSSSVRGRTNASRHVWAKIGRAFLSAGIFLDCAWAKGKASGRADAYAHAERFSWAYPAYPARKGFFGIGTPASSGQYQGVGNVARWSLSSCHRMGRRRNSDIRYGVGSGRTANFSLRFCARLHSAVRSR